MQVMLVENTVSMHVVTFVVTLFMATMVAFAAKEVILSLKQRFGSKQDPERLAKEAKQEHDRLHQVRAHQTNHGRAVFNFLRDQGFPEYISIQKIEDNGGQFTIQVRHGQGHILQLDFDFVSKFGKDCEGHVHYGAYGADCFFVVYNHTRLDHGLHDLVLKHIKLYILQCQALVQASE